MFFYSTDGLYGRKILSINIDMGMNYNGIYYVFLEKSSEDKYDIKEKSTVCISLPKPDSIKYSKAGRRSKRHITAGYQREKLAKRLFDEIIDIKSFPEKQQEKLHGLFKNIGFTYLTISDEFEQVDDEYIDYIDKISADNENYMLKNLYTLEDIEAAFQNYSASDKELLYYIETVLNEIKSLLESYNEYLEKKKI